MKNQPRNFSQESNATPVSIKQLAKFITGDNPPVQDSLTAVEDEVEAPKVWELQITRMLNYEEKVVGFAILKNDLGVLIRTGTTIENRNDLIPIGSYNGIIKTGNEITEAGATSKVMNKQGELIGMIDRNGFQPRAIKLGTHYEFGYNKPFLFDYFLDVIYEATTDGYVFNIIIK